MHNCLFLFSLFLNLFTRLFLGLLHVDLAIADFELFFVFSLHQVLPEERFSERSSCSWFLLKDIRKRFLFAWLTFLCCWSLVVGSVILRVFNRMGLVSFKFGSPLLLFPGLGQIGILVWLLIRRCLRRLVLGVLRLASFVDFKIWINVCVRH